MANLAAASGGATIVSATCFDEAHPPMRAIDGSDRTFWALTGMAPHELVIKLSAPADVAHVGVVTTGVARLEIEHCAGGAPTSWTQLCDIDLEDSGLRPQRQTVDVPRTHTAFLKVRVAATHDDFAAVHVLSVEA